MDRMTRPPNYSEVPNSGRLLVTTNRPANGSKMSHRSQKSHFGPKNPQTLSPILKAFPWSNFKFRPIFRKLRQLSFSNIDTRSRQFHSFRAKNCPQKEQLAKNRQNLKKFDFHFWSKMVGNMLKRALLVKFLSKNWFWKNPSYRTFKCLRNFWNIR